MEIAGAHPKELYRLQILDVLGLVDGPVDHFFQATINLLAESLDIPIVQFTIIDANTQHFLCGTGLDIQTVDRSESFCAHTILSLSGRMVVEDTRKDSRFIGHPFVKGEPYVGFYAGEAVRAYGHVPLGTICLMDHMAQEPSEKVLNALNDARVLMEQYIDMMLELGRDHLTGLFNRRYFDEQWMREWRRASRHRVSLGILVIDIDYFKKYNDRYGHQKGDDCLCMVADALRMAVQRSGEFVARYGGEEFVLVLPGVSLECLQSVADRVIESISMQAIPHLGSDAGVVTVSVGGTLAASDKEMALGAHALLEQADAGLYTAKQNGRNQAHVEAIVPGQSNGRFQGERREAWSAS